MPQKKTYTLDVESYPNLFTVQLQDVQNPSLFHLFSTHLPQDRTELQNIISNPNNTLITFNGNSYDMLMVDAYLHTPALTPDQLNQVSNLIIQDELKPHKFSQVTGIHKTYRPNHIDLIEVAPGKASLKAYAARLHTPMLQDLPYPPDSILTKEQKLEIVSYCFKDLSNTSLLLHKLLPQLQLRTSMSRLYGTDLRSKSDAQIAETVIVSELTKLLQEKPKRPPKSARQSHVFYEPPPYLRFHTKSLHDALTLIQDTPIPISSTGKLDLPKEIKDIKLTINSTTYALGIGGLHSKEKEQAVIPNQDQLLADFDVTSYYPSIILNNSLYPEHLTSAFLQIYESIVKRRIEAKRRVNEIRKEIASLENIKNRIAELKSELAAKTVEMNSLKLTINGSFGKFGSPYSVLYAPKLLIQTTITGQLSLLLLIEWLEAYGFHVVSANTDGIVTLGNKEKEPLLNKIIAKWEETTNFNMERTDYKALYSRDVNNYIAVKPDNSVKTKGVFAYAGLQKNPVNEICTEAVINYLTNNTPVDITIRQETDVRKFLQARSVTGGATKDDLYLGKVVRWYYSTATNTPILYKKNGNKVPSSDNGAPLMELTNSIPKDLDKEAYIKITQELFMDLGVMPRPPKTRKRRTKTDET